MCRPWIWIWGVIPVAFLTAMAYFFIAPKLENELGLNAEQALRTAGQGWATVKIKGRDVLLGGTAPSKEALDQAVDVAAGVSGVRRVDQNVVVRVAN